MNLNSPFFKMDVRNVFIVYYLNANGRLISYSENPYYYEYGCTYKLYIRINNKKKIVYYNEDDDKYYDVISGEEVEVHSPSYSGKEYEIETRSAMKRIDISYYGYPVPFKEFFKDEIEKNAMEKVSVRKAISMFHNAVMNEEKKDAIILSPKPFKAVKQLKNYCGYTVPDNMKSYDKVAEMQDRIEELFEADSTFSNEAHKKIEELIEKYNKSVKESKPHFSIDSKIELKFESLNPFDQLIDDLEKLYYKYSSQLETIRIINELEACKTLIESGKDNDNINGNIIDSVRVANANFKYLGSKEHADKKDSLLSIIKREIDELNESLYNDDNPLVINNQLPIQIQIKSVIDDINTSAMINKPYVDLRDAFLSEQDAYIDGDSITDLIASIKFIISKIDNKTLKDELISEFASIKEEYTSLLSKIVESDEKKDFKELEINLRRRLEPFLIKLDFSTNKKLNQIISAGSLIIQLDKSLYIINRNDFENNAYDKIDEPITRNVIELLKMANGLEDREKIVNKIIEAINKKKEMLSKITINNYNDYKKYRNDILRALMKIKLYVLDHKGKLKSYSNNIIL